MLIKPIQFFDVFVVVVAWLRKLPASNNEDDDDDNDDADDVNGC